MIKVFLTGAGGAGTIEVIRSLRATGRYTVVTADASPHAGGYAFADRSFVMPWANDARYLPALRSILTETQPDFVVPLIDEEIVLVHDLVAKEFPKTKVVAPRPEFCEAVMDKWVMAQRMEQHHLPVARTWLATDVAEAIFPAIVKPRVGRGSRGFETVDSPSDVAGYLERTKQAPDRVLVQERLKGREFTTSAVVTLGGRVLAVVPKEAVAKRGITQVGVTRNVPTIDRAVRDIQERMRADGPFNVQLMLDATNCPHVFEINPRYSTTVALTLGAGLDEVDLVMREALGEDVVVPEWRPNTMMVRYMSQEFVDESGWSPTDLS